MLLFACDEDVAGIGDELQERDTCDVDVMSICGAGDCDEEEVILSLNLW